MGIILLWAVLFFWIAPFGLLDWESWLLVLVPIVAVLSEGFNASMERMFDVEYCGLCGEDLYSHTCPRGDDREEQEYIDYDGTF